MHEVTFSKSVSLPTVLCIACLIRTDTNKRPLSSVTQKLVHPIGAQSPAGDGVVCADGLASIQIMCLHNSLCKLVQDRTK